MKTEKMKSSSEVLDFHVSDLTPRQRSRVLAAMLFYAREEGDQIHEAWDRNRKDMGDTIDRLVAENRHLNELLEPTKEIKQ